METVRVLLFSVIFSIILSVSFVHSFEVRGEIPENLKDIIETYYDELGVDGVERILKAFHIELYILTKDYLKVEKGLRIKSIKFKGNFSFLDSKLKDVAGLYPNNLFNAHVLLESKNKLLEFYRSQGFADAVVSYQSDNGEIIFHINEGRISIINEIKIEGVKLKIDYSEFKNSFILNPENIRKIENKITYELRKNGYFYFNISYKTVNNNKRAFFYNHNYPLVTFLSVFPNTNNSKSLIFTIDNLKKYSLIINADDNELRKDILVLLWRELVKIDYFHIRKVENSIKNILKVKSYQNYRVEVKVDGNNITVDVVINKKSDIKPVILKFKNSKTYDLFTNKSYFSSISKIENLKNQLINILKSYGFLDAEVEKEFDTNKNITLIFREGIQYKINFVKLENLEINSCKDMIYNKNNLEKCLKKVDLSLSDKYFYNILQIKSIEKKQPGKVNLILRENLLKPKVKEIICSNNTLLSVIKKHYFKNKSLTKEKISEIKKILKYQEAVQSSKITVVRINDENVILCIYLEYKKPNEFFGGLTYDSIDGMRFHLGYIKHNFLNTAHDLSLFTLNSFRENLIQLKIYGNGIIYKDVSDTVSYLIRDRDEYDFKYKQNRFSLTFGNRFSHLLLNGSVYLESIDIYENEYTETVNNDLTYYFNNIGVVASVTVHDLDNIINPSNGMALKYQINPVFSEKTQFHVNVVSAAGYKSFNHFTLSLKAEIGKIFGETNEIPLTYRFTLGGPYKMKAFDYREIGAMDEEKNVYGGESYAYGEILFKYNVNDFVSTGPFYEFGMAEEYFNLSDFYNDIGVMLEIKTPIGPLKFSYAVDTEKRTRRAFYITFGTTIP